MGYVEPLNIVGKVSIGYVEPLDVVWKVSMGCGRLLFIVRNLSTGCGGLLFIVGKVSIGCVDLPDDVESFSTGGTPSNLRLSRLSRPSRRQDGGRRRAGSSLQEG